MTTKEAIDIEKADVVLRQAKELVYQAYQLILSSNAAKNNLKFDCVIGWETNAWNKLNEAYSAENPDSKETYHLKAFDYFGLECGSCISLNGMSSCSAG